MRRLLLFGLTIGLVLATAGCGAGEPELQAVLGAVEATNADDTAGYARAFEPRPFTFPADHGPHPQFQTEWWYYTGNLRDETGRHFGFQLTFFRRALTPEPPERESDWATGNLYMAHFALSDTAGGTFYAFERFSRDAANLAGAGAEPFRVFLDDWSATGSGPEAMTMQLQAATPEVAIDLRAVNARPPTLQGDRGLSQKGPSPGNASYYYSLTRMETAGTVRVGTEQFQVTGLVWMDREWSTSALEGDLAGWDWFALQLSDGSDLMIYRLRRSDGSASEYTGGSLTRADGTVTHLSRDDVRLTPLETWRSPRSNAEYPVEWQVELPRLAIDLNVAARLADQELPVSVVYWEGSVAVEGRHAGVDVRGDGYVELTGYADELRAGR
jgi:predicted secreted hydrolase